MTTQRSCTATRISVALALWVAVAAEANHWSQLSPSGTAPRARVLHTSVWSDVADGMYVFGGAAGESGSSYFNDLHFFDRQANRWSQLSPGGTAPAARWGHTSAWCDVADGMYVFGGCADQSGDSQFNDLHFFDRQANRWSQLSPGGTAPAARWGHTSVWSDVADGMYVFGGRDGYSETWFNDLRFYERQANRWSQLSPGGTAPAGRDTHSAVWCDVADGMYVFGGGARDGHDFNDLHFFDRQANRWSQLSPGGTAPAVRWGHTSVWSDVADGMYVFGGYVGSGRLNDFHFYDRQANRWSQLSPSGTAPTARSEPTSVWSDVADGMYVFGGAAGESGEIQLNDLHFFDRQTTITKTTVTATTTATTSQTTTTKTTVTATTTAATSQAPAFLSPHYFDQENLPDGSNLKDETLSTSSTTPSMAAILFGSGADDDYTWLIWIGVVAAVGALALAAVMLWRCQAHKKSGYLASSQRGEGSISSFPAMVPVVPTPEVGPSHVKPLLFAWDARMTAEWPRGKVLRLIVNEDTFGANGHQYQFHGDRQFTWEDGTIQTLESIDRNVASWSTNHERSEWCRFRWICTPQVVPGHDMTLTETDSEPDSEYRCHSCRRGVSEKHWHSAEHQVHLCPTCAELPPEVPTLGVAARYLVDVFPDLARSASGKENPNFYEICPTMAHGDNGLGFQKTCPRDGKPNCSIVDALNETCNGRVTHFVSWCWSYKLDDFVSAVKGWVRKSGVDGEDVFLWICFFCNNQYRIFQEATQTGADELKSIFESHLVEAGHMLVLLDTIEQPAYSKRAWCIFESYVCIEQRLPMTIILPSSAESFFKETVESGGIGILRNAVKSLDVRNAKASSRADEDLIKRLILTTIGFDRVNEAVKLRLRQQLTDLFDQLLISSPR